MDFSWFPGYFLVQFLEPFSWKFNENNDARIYAEKVMKNDEKLCENEAINLYSFEKCVHEKTYFSRKVNVRKPYVSSSRMGVAKGSAKKRKSEKWEERVKITSKKRSQKMNATTMKKPSKSHPKRMSKWRQNCNKSMPEEILIFWDPAGTPGCPGWVSAGGGTSSFDPAVGDYRGPTGRTLTACWPQWGRRI